MRTQLLCRLGGALAGLLLAGLGGCITTGDLPGLTPVNAPLPVVTTEAPAAVTADGGARLGSTDSAAPIRPPSSLDGTTAAMPFLRSEQSASKDDVLPKLPTFLSPGVHPLSFDVTSDHAAEAAEEADLQKKTLNPVSDLVSIPFQYNADFNIGPKNATRSILNIQPVIPVSISTDWNLIVRTIVPVVYSDSIADGISSKFGLGDTVQSFFFSPKAAVGGWILGGGPVFLYPSATDDALGSGKWGAGPTAVALRQDGPWTYGVLANHIWSFAGDHKRGSVNSSFVQPFVAYSFPTFTTLILNTETTYDWQSHQAIVPINLQVTQILKIGKLPVSVGIGPRYFARSSTGGPDWGFRFVFTILLPK